MRSLTVGIPSGRVLPSPFGISTRLTACGWYVPSRSAVESSSRYISAFAANRFTLCPSTPAAPLLARTFVHASASVAGAKTLSIRLNHLPPLTPLASADSMRSVHTPALTSRSGPRGFRAWVSLPCIASSALAAVLCCSVVIAHPPSCPAFPRHGFAFRASRGFRHIGTMRALTSGGLTHYTPVLFAYFALPSEHPTPNHIVCLDIAS